MTVATCPTPARLSAYALGKLPEAALREMARHTASCARCQEQLREADAACDPLLAHLRRPRPVESDSGEKAMARLLGGSAAQPSDSPITPDTLPRWVGPAPVRRRRIPRLAWSLAALLSLAAAAVLLALSLKFHGDHTATGTEARPTPAAPASPTPASQATLAARWRGPVDETFVRNLGALAPHRQVHVVTGKLRDFNPGFGDESLHHVLDDRQDFVRWVHVPTDAVTDLSPLRALTMLQGLKCSGSAPGKGRLVDLGPLRGLPLKHLECQNNRITDLSPLRDMPLEGLWCDLDLKRDAHTLLAIKTLKRINGKAATVVLGDPVLCR